MLMYDDDSTMLLFLLTIFIIALFEFFKHRTERNPLRDAAPAFCSTITAPDEDIDTTAPEENRDAREPEEDRDATAPEEDRDTMSPEEDIDTTAPEENSYTTASGTSRRENGGNEDVDREKIPGENSDSLRSQPDGVSRNSMEFSDPPSYEDLQSLDGPPTHLKLCKAKSMNMNELYQSRRLLMKSRSLRNFRCSDFPDSGISSKRSSSMSPMKDFNILADADPVQLGIHTFSATETIGSQGGTVAVAGCTIRIPTNALDHEETIELKCYFNVPSDDDNICITPTIHLGPNGLKFNKEVIVMLPTCYKSINAVVLQDVTIQVSDGEEWRCHCVGENSFPGKIVFKTMHFSWFRSLVESIFQSHMVKMIQYSGYIKRFNLQDNPLTHTLVGCFCDNLDVFVSQIDSEMNGNYEKVILSETFQLKHLENLKIVNRAESDDVSVNPASSVVSNNDLWLPGSVRKLQFRITRNSSFDMSGIVSINFVLTSGRGPVQQAEYPRNGNYSFAWENQTIPTTTTYIDRSHIGVLHL